MKPSIGRGARSFVAHEEKKPSVVRYFIEINTHHNITLKREYVYIEDVKVALNINTLEERIRLKRWLIKQLQKGQAEEASSGALRCTESTEALKPIEKLIQVLFDSEEKDRHRLQKDFKISL